VLRGFFRAPSGVAGLIIICALVIIAVVAPALWSEQARSLNVGVSNQNPSPQHVLGTDQLGRDILLRVLTATQLSLILALGATALGAGLGIPAGAGAAVLPPRLRTVALRVIDSLLAFPALLVAIFVGAIAGPGAFGAMLGVGIAASFTFARIASSLALGISGREYVSAARVLGLGRGRVLLRYVLPNVAETLIIGTTVAISSSLVAVSSLSFLGLGVQPPDSDWGRMLTDGVQAIYVTPAAALAPAVAIAVTALAFGFFGEALACATNPLLQTSPATGRAVRTTATSRNGTRPHLEPVPPAEPMAPLVLEVRDLVVEFPGPHGYHPVVDGVSFSLRKGDKLGIVGESGSGKSTTALAIAQLVPFPGRVHGSVRLDGHDLSAMRPHERDHLLGTDLAVVYQDPLSSLNPGLKIGVQLVEGVEVHRKLNRKQAEVIAIERLRETNIASPELQLERHSHELSGGMRQRVMIAMGLMNDPALLIADEPTTALDVTVQAQIMDVLDRVNREHEAALILISHNLGLVSQNCQRVLLMYAGRVVEEVSAENLVRRPLHPYTRALLGSVPGLAGGRERLEFIPGQAPDPAALPPGCPYNPRCPLAVERCTVERPPLLRRPEGGAVACWVANEDIT
jgi:peptide/nickel transport system permease protein